jgi:hypothetical protein
MKVLLIHNENEKAIVEELKTHLSETGILVEVFPVKTQEETRGYIQKQFAAFYNSPASKADVSVIMPTHVLIVSALTPGWIDFLTGFSCGSNIPFLVYTDKAAKCIPEEYSFSFQIVKTEQELQEYMIAEYGIYKKMDADRGTNAARDTILKMGIPVNEKAMVNCVSEGSLREILFFLAAGFSPDTKCQAGVPLFSIAARKGNREIIRFLYLAGAQINAKSRDRGTSALIDSVIIMI